MHLKEELLFLHDLRVPVNGSLCERLACFYKRKQKQAIVFRSQEHLGYLCDALNIVYLLPFKTSGSVYEETSSIFGRMPPTRLKDAENVIQ